MTTSRGELALRETQALKPGVAASLTGDQLKFIANTAFVPAIYRGKLPEIMACVAYGRALGIPDMQALNEIYLIDGRPTYSAHLMSALARKQGHGIEVKTRNAKECTIVGKRADNGNSITVTWTMERAEQMGLASKGNWKKMPEQMLWARAVSQLCRELFSDCFGGGAPYTPEEIGDIVATDDLMVEPVGGDASAGSDADEDGEVVAETDEPAADPEQAQVPLEPEPASESITQGQKDRLLELFADLNQAKPGTNWSRQVGTRLQREYGVQSFTALNREQLDGLLGYLDGELTRVTEEAAA